MSKLGVTPQNYTLEVPGYEGKIHLRRLSAREVESVASMDADENKALTLVALAALNQNGNQAYSQDQLDEIKDDLPPDLIVAIALEIISQSKGKADSGN